MRSSTCWQGCLLVTLVGVTTHCGTVPPARQATTGPEAVQPAVSGTGDVENLCPDTPMLAVAMRVSTPEGGRWMLHEREAVRQGELFPADADEGARPMSEGEAKAHGASAAGLPVWVYLSDEAPPCRMETGAPWAVHYGDGPLRTHVFSELAGACELDEQAPSYLVVRGVEEARGCRMHALPLMAADEEGTGVTPVPEAVKKILPPNRCEEPKCFRWIALGGHVDGGAGVYEVGAVWVQPVEGDDPPCAAPFDGFHGVYFQASTGAPWQEVPEVTGVRALMYDRRGLRAVITDAGGILGLLSVGKDGLQRAWEQRYVSWNEENRSRIEEIQPSCL